MTTDDIKKMINSVAEISSKLDKLERLAEDVEALGQKVEELHVAVIGKQKKKISIVAG